MNNITFEKQYNKIVTAYMKEELDPLSACGCFIGNLLNNNKIWALCRDYDNRPSFLGPISIIKEELFEDILKEEANNFYSPKEIVYLEKVFLTALGGNPDLVFINTKDEDKLYNALEVTLLELKKIHERKGEVIKDYSLNKRELVN